MITRYLYHLYANDIISASSLLDFGEKSLKKNKTPVIVTPPHNPALKTVILATVEE
jgi:hypothetical protein